MIKEDKRRTPRCPILPYLKDKRIKGMFISREWKNNIKEMSVFSLLTNLRV